MKNNQCPCGRARRGCDYHDPDLQPGTTWVSFFYDGRFVWDFDRHYPPTQPGEIVPHLAMNARAEAEIGDRLFLSRDTEPLYWPTQSLGMP